MTATYDPLRHASEAQIQSAILDYLTVRGVVAFRVNSGSLLLQNAGGGTRRVQLAPKGTSDIVAIMPGTGQFVGIECKKHTGKQTPEQVEFEQRVKAAGGVYVVARSIDDVEQIFEEK